jgi:protease I
MAHILILISPKDFRDEEYFEPKRLFEIAGHTVVTASLEKGLARGSRGGEAIVNESIERIVSSRGYDAIVVVGGSGSSVYDDDNRVHEILRSFEKDRKLIAAICHAPVILAKAGLLRGKRATVFAPDAEVLHHYGVHYTASSVETDGLFITADGPSSAVKFARGIIHKLHQ